MTTTRDPDFSNELHNVLDEQFNPDRPNAVWCSDITHDVFKEKLCQVSLKEIQRSARERHPGAMGYAETMVVYYNKKNRYPLHWDKLYDRKKGSKKNDKDPNDPLPPFTAPDVANNE